VTKRIYRKIETAIVSVCLAACSGATVDELRDPVPESLVSVAAMPGYSGIRYWGDDASSISKSALRQIGAQRLRCPG
jgi:hypothetical protein